MRKVGFLLTVGTLLASSSLVAQDHFNYEFFRVEQRGDEPRYEVAFYNTATDFEDESKLYVLIKVLNDAVQFIKADGDKFGADFEVTATILDTSDTVLEKKVWSEHVVANNFDEVNARDLFTLTLESFFMRAGRYKFRIELKDQETRRVGLKEGALTLRDFSHTQFAVSDVVVVDPFSIGKVTDLAPQVATTNGPADYTNLFAYFEIYNVPQGDTLQIDFEIENAKGEITKQEHIGKPSAGRITSAIFELGTDLVFAGRNRLKLKILAGSDSLVIAQDRIDPFKQVSYPIFEQLADSIEKLRYIAKNDEFKRLKSLKGEEQLEEFMKFWKKRDPSPLTPENEYLEEYYRRVAIANRNFKGVKDGWETDMGKIFIMLGNPDYTYRYEGNEYYGSTNIGRYPIIYWQYSRVRRTVIFRHRAGEYRIENYHEIATEIDGEMKM